MTKKLMAEKPIVEKQRILIVDDDTQNIKVAANALHSNDLIIGFARSGKEALERVEETNFDLILMDIMMPGMDGFEVCAKLKENPLTERIPILFLTAKTDDDSIERAYQVGGYDYITKPFRPRELVARVKLQLSQLALIRKLDYMASRDALTGIYNRRFFFQLSEKLFTGSNNDLVALMIDIDHFKNVNDTYGHQTGDKVLKSIVETIITALPENAIFGRLGGEEFAIMLGDISAEQGLNYAELLRESIATTLIAIDDNTELNCTVSIGLGTKENTSSLDELLKSADDMLYTAKKEGRNRTVLRGINSA